MRFTLALFALLAALFAVAQANDCIMTKCAYQLDACAQDMSCSASLECAISCDTFDTACIQGCANEAYVLDLIAEDEHELRIMSKCNIIKKAECAVGVAAAISSCGGPANIPCIISRLKALHGCGKCFCQTLKCRGLCKDFC
ncbi:uncharacterized protein ACA1_116700 [Acanthamoeba castellanii str. Neff]|uniref:Acanthaporin domain-containing protein n=1 Tax=Acanthamoeba castellanii (strain ATCC 30010 / Neff) TaxID=1257118 RepID=L8H629_ACACF|nr:uncharacterized protein ACA1_116700 [Acanthamoeba castellanii str. Neff]ELR20198.1 hypothetical protein ACA1_116700 [Acanthamoeba castellanii str. Neff]